MLYLPLSSRWEDRGPQPGGLFPGGSRLLQALYLLVPNNSLRRGTAPTLPIEYTGRIPVKNLGYELLRNPGRRLVGEEHRSQSSNGDAQELIKFAGMICGHRAGKRSYL